MSRLPGARPAVRPRRSSLTIGPIGRLIAAAYGLSLAFIGCALPARAVILWSDAGATTVRESGVGKDILGGAVKRDDASSDTLYFKFHLDPRSDVNTEEYFAGFELFEGDAERLGIGNAAKAWAYSAFFRADDARESNRVAAYIDLRSSRPEASGPGQFFSYEVPRRGVESTILFKVQYIPGGDDLVTVWLNPDLGPGANEVYQPETLITRFNADAAFDEIRLRHGGGGEGWSFSDLAIATTFGDFTDSSSAKPGGQTSLGLAGLPFSFQSWQREQGMPHKSIQALAQTAEGYLWAGSDEGLARFDGIRFVSLETRSGWRASPVRALLGDRRGALWIGTAGSGVTRLLGGQFTSFTTRDGLPSDAIHALAEDAKNQLWVGTAAGLAVWREGRFVVPGSVSELRGEAVTALCKDGRGNLWIGVQGRGVFELHDDRLDPVTESSLEGLLQHPHCLLVDQAGRLWIGAGDDFVLCRDNEQWRRYRIPRHSARPWVSSLAEEPDGTVWAGSLGEGLFQFKDEKLTAVNANSGLSDVRVESLLVSRGGSLWIGTASGLNRLRRKNLSVFGQEEGLGYGSALGLAEVGAGVIWAAKPAEGLYRWSGGVFSRLNAAGLPPRDPQVSALLVARDGSCWVACSRGLLRFKDPQAVADESRFMGLAGVTIIALAEDPQGRIWAGTREGELWQLDRGQWARQTNAWKNVAVTALVPEPGDGMWVGTDGKGVYRIGPGVLAHFDKSAGLLSESVRTLHLAGDETLWIGTAGGGLSRLKHGRIETFTAREGLPDNTVSQILEDDAGRLWLGGNRGIACLRPADLDALKHGKIPTLYPLVYGRADGMPAEECVGGHFPAGLKTRNGLLWFSTLKGIAVADPRLHSTNTQPPVVVLEELLVDGVPAANFVMGASGTNSKSLSIEPGRHRFELQYSALGFDVLEPLRFRYRLEGLDAGWVEAGTRRTAFYNYVPPGRYRFHVIASSGDGNWNETGASLALAVSPHFWQRSWVIGLSAVGLVLLVAGGARLVEQSRLHQRLERLEQDRAMERERTRIARDLHDEMGAKLCRISFLSEHVRRSDGASTEVQQQIASISDASREVLHSLDEIVWAVNPKNDSLEHLASYIGHYAQEYFQMTGIECELEIPSHLPSHALNSQVRHHLFLAAHEAFTNILKHSGTSRARVTMSCGAAGFELTASDDGRGFDPATVASGSNGHSESGNGLRNMRQRLADIGGRCEISSGPGQGTRVHLTLPLNGLAKDK